MSNKESFTKLQESFVIDKKKSWLNEPKSQEELVKALCSRKRRIKTTSESLGLSFCKKNPPISINFPLNTRDIWTWMTY